MAGSFAEARAQILSLQPAVLRAKAGEVRSFGSASVSAGSTLRASADRLGARRGAPYQAYQERLAPTAGWLTGLSPLSNDTAATLVNAAQAGERAQMVLAQQEEALARFGVNPSTTPAAFAAAEAQALAALNTAIADVTQAYGVITPVTPTAAPVVANAAGGAGTGGGSAATGLNGVGGAVGASAGGVAAAAAAPAGRAVPHPAPGRRAPGRQAPGRRVTRAGPGRRPGRSPGSCRTRPRATSSIPPPDGRPTPAAASSTRSPASPSGPRHRSCRGWRGSTAA